MASQAPAPRPTPAPAPGETSLPTLLSSLNPILHPSTFCFVTVLPSTPVPADLFRQMSFAEAEGTTIITTRAAAAAHGLAFTFPCRMITLDVHSSLEAIGFIAHVAGKLSERGSARIRLVGSFMIMFLSGRGGRRRRWSVWRGLRGRRRRKGEGKVEVEAEGGVEEGMLD